MAMAIARAGSELVFGWTDIQDGSMSEPQAPARTPGCPRGSVGERARSTQNRTAVNRRYFATWLVLTFAILSGCACATTTSPTSDISRERAIEIARQQVSFEPTSIEAVRGTRQGRPVWVVTFRRADGSHGGLGQFAEITIDRATGRVVSVAMS